jgi:hypothetical protein
MFYLFGLRLQAKRNKEVSPSMALIKEFNYTIFSFIWDSESEMLYHNRNVLEGLKVLNPEMCIKGKKISYIRRNYKSSSLKSV